jgi:hypothetical protein
MKALLALAAVVAGIATASTALAASGPSFITDNSASQNRLGQPQTQSNPSFITENSASQNRLNPPVTLVAPAGFRWGDAGIGAAGMFGVVLLALGVALLVLRRRGHVAMA